MSFLTQLYNSVKDGLSRSYSFITDKISQGYNYVRNSLNTFLNQNQLQYEQNTNINRSKSYA